MRYLLHVFVTCFYVVSVFNLKIDGMARNGNERLCIRDQIKNILNAEKTIVLLMHVYLIV